MIMIQQRSKTEKTQKQIISTIVGPHMQIFRNDKRLSKYLTDSKLKMSAV